MKLVIVDQCTDRGTGWPNEDAVVATDRRAVVFDGATAMTRAHLTDAESDAAWLVGSAAEAAIGIDPDLPLDQALGQLIAEVADRFEAQRVRVPTERLEIPLAAMFAVQLADDVLDVSWFGDCAAYVGRPDGEEPILLGEAVELRAEEKRRVRSLQSENDGKIRWSGERLAAAVAARNAVNTEGGKWLFAPDRACGAGIRSARTPVRDGDYILLATDGFHALSTSYGLFEASEMIDIAVYQGLGTAINLLRAYEATDPEKVRHPRYKISDDASALLLQVQA